MAPKLRTWFLPAVALLLLLASCSKTNQQGKLVPKDAAAVLHINGKSLNEKLPWDEVKQNPLFQQAYADSALPGFMKAILDNPDNSGIDIKTDLLIFVEKDSLGGYAAIEGTVKDEAKFKQFNLDASKGSLTDENGLHFISKTPAIVGWNKDKFVYVIDIPGMKKRNRYDFSDDTLVPPPVKRDLLAACKSVFSLKSENSLGEDERFTSLMKKQGDIHFWLNTEQLYKSVNSDLGMLNMMKLDKFYEGNLMVATGNFDNGKISLEYTSYLGKELKKIIKEYSGGQVNEEMLKRIPGQQVGAVFAMHFKPEGIRKLVELSGMEGLLNIGLISMGFTMDDFIKANKGDIMVALTDFKVKNDSITLPGMKGDDMTFGMRPEPKPDVLFAASIGDKDAFNTLIKAGKRISKDRSADEDNLISYNMNDQFFAIGNSKANVDKFIGGSTAKFDFISHISGEPMAGYADLQYLMKNFPVQESDSLEKVTYEASLKLWENVYLKGGNYEDGGLSYHIEINLLDKNTNSLKQLNQYFGLIGRIMEEKRKKDEARFKDFTIQTETDSIAPVVSPVPGAAPNVKKHR